MKTTHLVGQLCCALLFLSPISLRAQVWTHILGAGEDLRDYVSWHPVSLPEAVELPFVDVAAAIREDQRSGNPDSRFGLEIPLSLTEADGTWQEQADGFSIWTMRIRSAGATSLNFVFRDVYLPQNAEMYLYTPAGFMVMGPVTDTHIHDGIYATDLLYGEEVVVAVRMPGYLAGEFRLWVEKGVHGYGGRGSRVFGEAAECNVDVNCKPVGDNWKRERDAVGMIIEGNVRLCSGALINTACPTLRPLFLTAFHCIDENENGTLSSPEIATISTWIFRFNYQSPEYGPNPPADCRGPEPASWLTYSGAVLRASWFDSDMALLELTGSILGQSSLALAGWTTDFDFNGLNGVESIPGPVTTIHHPRGDVKMISLDGDDAIGTLLSSAQDVWHVDDWDIGTTEGGSSGGPFFNSNRRIVGQVLGGDGPEACDTDKGTFFGRFDASWTGGSTSDSRLSNHLGNAPTSTSATNSMRVPSVSHAGSNVICTDGKLFSLSHAFPGTSISWSTTPSEMFQNSSGNGAEAFLLPLNSAVSGHATLTFTMTFSNGCPMVQLSRSVWVGVPMAPELETNPLPHPVSNIVELGQGDLLTATVMDFSGASPSSLVWKATGSVDFKTPPGGIHALLEAISTGPGDIRVESSNECGISPSTLVVVDVLQNLQQPEVLVKVGPNPARDYVVIEALWENPANHPGTIELKDLTGKTISTHATDGRITRVPLYEVSKGVLFVRVSTGARALTQKIIVID